MLLRAVALHGLFQLLEAGCGMLWIDFGTQCGDLMLQIVRKAAQRFDVFLRLQIFLMLAFQLRVDRREFRVRFDATRLLLLRVQNRETAEINQRANVEDLLADRTGKRRIRRYETQIAHGECDDHDGHRRNRGGSGRQSRRGLTEIAAFNQPSQTKAQCIRNDQQHDRTPIVIGETIAHTNKRNDLPMQRRYQFRQHERACRNIQAFAFAGARAKQNRRIHAGECEQHADNPEPDRHTAVKILHCSQQQQSGRADDDRPLEWNAPIQHCNIHHAGSPFADRRI